MRFAGTFLFILLLSLVIVGQNDSSPQTLISNSSHLVTYEVLDGNVIFTLESIADFTDDTETGGKNFSKKDFAGITIDVNANHRIDERVDIAFGIRQGSTKICPQFIYDERSSSLCGQLRSAATLKVSFVGTPAEARPHPVYEFRIPRSEITDRTRPFGVVIQFHTAGLGTTYYPEKPSNAPLKSFKNTIEMRLQ